MQQFPVIDSVDENGKATIQNYTTSFLDEVNANYVWRVYDPVNSALSLEAVYTFLYVLAVLTSYDDDVREIPEWERETTYDVAIMLALTEIKSAEYTPAIERHKYLQTFRAYVAAQHLGDSTWERRVECLALFIDLAIPNVMTIRTAKGGDGHVFKAQRCLSDAWRIFPIFMENPRLQYSAQSAWNAACMRVDTATEYCGTVPASNMMARLYPNFSIQRNSHVGSDHKITLAILQQQKIIEDAQAQIIAIRTGCTHPKEAIVSYSWGNSGNYDPHDDCYGREDTCKICGNVAHYQTESGKNGYHWQYNTATTLPAKSRSEK